MADLWSLVSLLRLVSPALPVGAFAYSRGLEGAVARGLVRDEGSAAGWIIGLLERATVSLDGPLLLRVHAALERDDFEAAAAWIELGEASRESAELLLEDRQIGRALLRLLSDLGTPRAAALLAADKASVAAGFAVAGLHAGIPARELLAGFFYASVEGQVSAAVRLVPLGQTAGQRILSGALAVIPRCVERAVALGDDELGNLAPGHAIASALHETQYTRLFRS
jgi:urease accessory protein